METKEPAVTVETHQPSDMMSAKTMFRIGIALVLGAVAFFLRYSFEQGWIDPPVQLGMAAGAGLAMIVAGSQMVGRRILYGNLLQGAGGATLYLTAFAAQRRLDAVDLTTGFVLLVAVSAGVVGLALRRRSEMLAGTGLTGAIAAPVLIGGTITAFPGDSGYLMVVLAAAGALYLWRSWLWTFIATSAGVTAVLGLDVVVGLGGRGDPAGLQLGLAGLWILVWGVSMIGAVRRPDDELRASVVPAVTSAAMPLAAYLGTVVVWGDALPAPARMAIALGMATAHGVALLWLRTTRVPALLVYAQTAPITVLAAMAWIEGLDGHAILLAFAVQAVVMIVTGVRRHVDVVAYLGHVLAIVTAGAWMVMSFEPDGVFDMNDVLSAAVVACAVVAAVLIRESDEPHATLALVYGAMSLPAAMLWATSSLGHLPQGSALVTGAWAATGLVTIVMGHMNGNGLARNAGVAVVLVAIGRLVLVDMATAHPLTRMALFGGIGLALLGLGYWLGGSEDGERRPAVPRDGESVGGV